MPAPEALPVVLRLAGPAAGRIRRHLEGELGWQPVESDGLVRAAVRIVDVPGAAAMGAPGVAGPAGSAMPGVPGGAGARDGPEARSATARPSSAPPHPRAPGVGAEMTGGARLATWLIVTDDDDALTAARAAAMTGAVAVLPWPPEPDAFASAAAALTDIGAPGGDHELRVGGASGGVGCTTVALAVAGLSAWSGRPTLAITHGAVPHPVGRTVDGDTLRSPDLARVARPARGVAGLGVVHARSAAAGLVVRVDGHDVVRDLGVTTSVDLLVVRRDAAGLAALADTTAGTVLVSDVGPAPLDAFRRAAGGRRCVILPWSARVARAGLLGRVPASLPGSWLRLLADVAGRRPQAPGAGRPRPERRGLR